jgi:hypothetical protein
MRKKQVRVRLSSPGDEEETG